MVYNKNMIRKICINCKVKFFLQDFCPVCKMAIQEYTVQTVTDFVFENLEEET